MDQTYSDSIKKVTFISDTISLFQPVSKKYLVPDNVNDSEVSVFGEKCVVFSIYSDSELSSIEKESKSEDEYEAFYDDYSYYANKASLFLYKKTTIKKTELNKKYIQFILSSGKKITIDRYKSAETIFFFNPKTGVKQCDIESFDSLKYTDY